MKTKKIFLSIERAKSIIDGNTPCTQNELQKTIEELVTASDSLPDWLVIVLKTLVYLLGLILAGVGTATVASCCIPNLF